MKNGNRQPIFEKAAIRALNSILENQDIEKLYKKALTIYGEGELLTKIMDSAIATIEKEDSYESLFLSEDDLMPVFYGIWLQFLMVEIGGIKQEKLQTIAKSIFEEQKKLITIH